MRWTLLEDHSYTQVVKLTGISKSTLIRERKRRQHLQSANHSHIDKPKTCVIIICE